MKKVAIALLFISGLALASQAEAAAAKRPAQRRSSSSSSNPNANNQVFVNIGGLIYGTPTIGYERGLSLDQSVTGQLAFRSYGVTGYNVTYFGLLGSWRFWPMHEGMMRGFYAGPMAGVNMVTASFDWTVVDAASPTGFSTRKETVGGTIITIGGEGGYQYVFPNAPFVLNGGLNLGFAIGGISSPAGAASFSGSGFGAGLNASAGYMF